MCSKDRNNPNIFLAVWQIAQRDYKFGKGKHKSLTKATYDAIGDHFRNLWGKDAGWAHSVLFTADLRAFSERLTTKVEVKEEKKTLKSEPKDGKTDRLSREEEIKGEISDTLVKVETTKDEVINDEDTGRSETGVEIKGESPMKRVKMEQVEEDHLESDGDSDSDLTTTNLEVKQELSNGSIKTESTTNGDTLTNGSALKPEIKDDMSATVIKSEAAAEHTLNGSTRTRAVKEEIKEEESNVMVKTEAVDSEMNGNGSAIKTKTTVSAGIKREAPEDSEGKDEPSRSKRARGRRSG